jgi:hypothetical protein
MGNRQAILRAWMDEHERGPAWVARKVGRTRKLISRIYNGHLPVSDKLARALQERLCIPLLADRKTSRNDASTRTRTRGKTRAKASRNAPRA